jgi:hypothetical protein
LALVVATTRYADTSLRQLRAPARDADDLRDVLADPHIGGFAVSSVVDGTAQQVRLAVEEFLTGRSFDDLLLVYLSCHGLVDLRRRLYFAATDTLKNRLAATGVEAQWLLDQLDDCRARRQLLILDCCFSGAFAHRAKADTDLALGKRFHGQGRGRVVLTASRGSEYSFEGEPVPGSAMPGSVFTSALVAGIRTGAADTDHDGYISVDDAYAYAFDHLRAADVQQTPQRWLYGAEGTILLARNPVGITITPADLPEVLRTGLDSPHPAIRLGAVAALGEWLADKDPARVLAARHALGQVADTDIPRVATAAQAMLQPGSPPSNAAGDDSARDDFSPAADSPAQTAPKRPAPEHMPVQAAPDATSPGTRDTPQTDPSLHHGGAPDTGTAAPAPAGPWRRFRHIRTFSAEPAEGATPVGGPIRLARPVRPRRRRLVYSAGVAVVLAAASTSAALLILDRDSPGEGGRPTHNEFTAASLWRLTVSNKIAAGDKACSVTVTNSDTGDKKVFENIWGTRSFQMQNAGTFRWEANDPGCLVVQHSGTGKAVLPFSQKAGTGDTAAFTAPKTPGTVVVRILAFNSYGKCDFELRDAADGQLLDLGPVHEGGAPLRLDPNGRSQVYLAAFEGCDVRLSAG